MSLLVTYHQILPQSPIQLHWCTWQSRSMLYCVVVVLPSCYWRLSGLTQHWQSLVSPQHLWTFQWPSNVPGWLRRAHCQNQFLHCTQPILGRNLFELICLPVRSVSTCGGIVLIFFYASRQTHKAWRSLQGVGYNYFVIQRPLPPTPRAEQGYPLYSPYECRLGFRDPNNFPNPPLSITT